MKDFFPILKNKQFMLLWTSQLLSQLTVNMLNFLLLVRIFENTHSPIATSFLWVAYALPAVVIGPLAAASVDMIDRRKTLIATNLSQALVILVYALLARTSLFLLYGIILTYSLLNQFYVPAEQAALPSVVKKEFLARANALFFLTVNAAVVFGFGIAGVFLKYFGFEQSLYICSALLFIAFLSVTRLRKLEQGLYKISKLESGFVQFFGRIVEGYNFIKGNKPVFNVFIMFLGLQVALATLVTNLPVIGTDLIGISARATGPFVAIPAGLGALFGTLFVTRLLSKGQRKIKVVLNSLFLTTFVIFMFVFIVPEVQLANLKLGLSMLGVFLAGLSFVGMAVPAQTFLQEKTPGGLQGRVFGNFWFLATVLTIIPVVGSGTLAELFGIRVFLTVIFGITLFVLISVRHSMLSGDLFGEDKFRE
jgi:MFS family permease